MIMDKENVLKVLEELNLKENIELKDIPDIDLYMDQVIQLFEKGLGSNRRNEEDKILTKTMINNYAKGKLLMPIKNKKYTKEHIMLMSLIYNFKGALAINDIKSTLDELVQSHEEEDKKFNIEKLYESYLRISKVNAENFETEIQEQLKLIDKEVDNCDDKSNYEKKLLLICSLVNLSNTCRRMAEKLVDEIGKK